MTVAAVLALAVVGTGAAFAYRTYVGSPRSGEPPIIKADNSPTKVVPAPADWPPARRRTAWSPGDGGEKLVSREETPVDVNSRSGGPRVVFPPLNQNGSPPPVSSVSPSAPQPTAANGTMPNSEPRKIKTLAVKGDAADNGGAPATVAPPAKAGCGRPSRPRRRRPRAIRPRPTPARRCRWHRAGRARSGTGNDPDGRHQSSGSGAFGRRWIPGSGVLADQRGRRASFLSIVAGQIRVGAWLPTSRGQTADLSEKGIFYRAFAGPFGSAEEATQVCNSLKAAGGPVRHPKELTAVSLTREP